jgi:hypothetical protein
MKLVMKNRFDEALLQTTQVCSIVMGQPVDEKGLDSGLNITY